MCVCMCVCVCEHVCVWVSHPPRGSEWDLVRDSDWDAPYAESKFEWLMSDPLPRCMPWLSVAGTCKNVYG